MRYAFGDKCLKMSQSHDCKPYDRVVRRRAYFCFDRSRWKAFHHASCIPLYETDRQTDRDRQTETNRDKQRETETDRECQRRTCVPFCRAATSGGVN